MLILSSGELQNCDEVSAVQIHLNTAECEQFIKIRPNSHSLNREHPFAEQLLRQLSLLIYVILLVFTVFCHKFVYYCTEMISLPSLRGEMISQEGPPPDAVPSGISFIK